MCTEHISVKSRKATFHKKLLNTKLVVAIWSFLVREASSMQKFSRSSFKLTCRVCETKRGKISTSVGSGVSLLNIDVVVDRGHPGRFAVCRSRIYYVVRVGHSISSLSEHELRRVRDSSRAETPIIVKAWRDGLSNKKDGAASRRRRRKMVPVRLLKLLAKLKFTMWPDVQEWKNASENVAFLCAFPLSSFFFSSHI